jgi:uncharacterized protein YndB with AHSA1/START domain
MGTFEVQTEINAPVADVWAALADIGSIYQWNPGVKASHATSDEADGMGATRHCDLGGKNFLDEEVVLWEPERKLTMRINDTNMPFDSADIRFTLEPNGDSTTVTCSPIYKIKYGPIGSLLDRFYVSRTYEKGMEALLAGLKKYVEAEKV